MNTKKEFNRFVLINVAFQIYLFQYKIQKPNRVLKKSVIIIESISSSIKINKTEQFITNTK